MPATLDARELIDELARAVGSQHVITETQPYYWDALGPGRGLRTLEDIHPQPLCAVRPSTTQEVATVVAIASRRATPVVPFGGGSGLMGGAVTLQPSIVLDMTRMDRVLEVRPDDQTVRVQAGAVLAHLDQALQGHGLMLGHDPWTVSVATVGGAISTDSLGYRGAVYGSMGDQVLGLVAVMPDASIVEVRPAYKRSVGPDLRRLFIGGEGCFGIVAEATLRVFPLPEERQMMAFEFTDFQTGFEVLLRFAGLGLTPAVLDYGDEFPNDPERPGQARLFMGFEGCREAVAAQAQRACALCVDAGGRDLGEEAAWEFWQHRHDIGDRFAERRRSGLARPAWAGSFDYVHVALPPSRVLEYRARCLQIIRARGLRPLETGVWCQPGLFSAAFTGTEGAPDARETLAEAVDEMLTLAQDLGGSMEYCHGVGLRLAHLMGRETGQGLQLLRKIKQALDPLGILNPGKLAL